MRIALFGYEGNPLAIAAEGGLRRLGHDIVKQAPNCFSSAQALRNIDGVVVCEMRGGSGEAARFYASRGLPVVAIDQPHLRRDQGRWFRVTPPEFDWLPEFEGKVPTDRLDALGIELGSRKRVKAQVVLVVGQRSGDPTHGLGRSEFERWALAVLDVLRRVYDGKVVWRPHPRDVYQIPAFDGWSDPREETLDQALEDAWLVVTLSSTSGLDALIAGLPVVAEGAAVYKAVTGSLDRWKDIQAPSEAELRDVLARIAYTQFSVEEMRTGEPFLRFFPDAVAAAAPPDEGSEPAEPAKEPSAPPAEAPADAGSDGEAESGGNPPEPVTTPEGEVSAEGDTGEPPAELPAESATPPAEPDKPAEPAKEPVPAEAPAAKPKKASTNGRKTRKPKAE
jgi:hypothetical protein